MKKLPKINAAKAVKPVCPIAKKQRPEAASGVRVAHLFYP